MFDPKVEWHGYADAKPSESIQKHEIPGLAVALAVPYQAGEDVLGVPVKQFKNYKRKKKADRARRLSQWLATEREQGLVLTGFVHAHTQVAAATLGLELIEELPNTHVDRCGDAFRLFFGDEHIDFAQAVALGYYFFTISFGILRAGTRIKPEQRQLFIAMDRFPGADTEGAKPGQRIPPSQGEKFIEFVQRRSRTGIGIAENNKSINLSYRLGTLDWWKKKGGTTWRKGKTHPHFVLPDWLAASAIAREFGEEFVATFPNEKTGNEAVEALRELHTVFKTFDFWSMDANVLQHIRADEGLWRVPADAREFVISRAESVQQ